MNKKWSETEKKYIKQHSSTMRDKDIAIYIASTSGREVSIQAVRKQRRKLGINKQSGRGVCKIVIKHTPIQKNDAEEKG